MKVEDLLEMSESELYQLIGKSLPVMRDDISPENKGRNWFRLNKAHFIKIVCPNYLKFKSMKKAEAIVEIAAAIGDTFLGVPAVFIATIIVNLTLDAFCQIQSDQ
ncbi:MAG: hypothetical protein HUU34_10825 [Saprospiraceae bacterium]|jgi:hypothetical protein|nr:hypothetical protein [Saprospiraceae bacterium]